MHATTLASLAGLLWNILDFYGCDADGLFRSEGLDPERMRDPNARFSDPRVDALWERAGALIDDPQDVADKPLSQDIWEFFELDKN